MSIFGFLSPVKINNWGQNTVGKYAKLNNRIIDKDVIIPDDEVIGHDLEKDRERFVVTENKIVVIPQGYVF